MSVSLLKILRQCLYFIKPLLRNNLFFYFHFIASEENCKELVKQQ